MQFKKIITNRPQGKPRLNLQNVREFIKYRLILHEIHYNRLLLANIRLNYTQLLRNFATFAHIGLLNVNNSSTITLPYGAARLVIPQ